MKKFLFIILFSFTIFIPKIVFASTSSTLQLQYYPLSDTGYEYIFKWLNDTSNDYIESKIGSYDYYIIWVNRDTTSNYTGYTIEMYFANNIFYLRNTYNTNGYSYFGPRATDKFNQMYTFTIYQPSGSNYFYSSNSNFTDNYKITSLSDNIITSQQNSVNGVEFSSYIYINRWSLNSQLFANWPNKTYMSNISLASNTTRNLLLYNADTLEEIATINQGEVFSGYRELFLDKPQYLNGYKKISLDTNSQYLLISGITSGKIFVPSQEYTTYKPGVSYFNSNLEYQPFDSYINDSNTTYDLQYVYYNFDISKYNGANAVLFSKYVTYTGDTSFTYDIYVPNSAFVSTILVSENSVGSNDFTYDISDSQGNITTETIQGPDLLQGNPFLNGLIDSFGSDTFGLSSIITAPLYLINQLTTSGCVDLTLPIPFLENKTLTLPCMYSVYSNILGDFFPIYQMITFGFVSYWVVVRILNLVKDFKNPDHDEVEVMDL